MRLRTIAAAVVLVALAATLLPAAAFAARPGRWELIGARAVSDRVETDSIAVTRAKGTFTALQFRVERRAVQFRSMKIHFANGDTQDVELRDVVPAGGHSRVIDVQGGDRIVRSVEFRYDAQSLSGRPATIKLFGRN
jgi:hypothetical protein